MNINTGIALTSTSEIFNDLSKGIGPKVSILALGYAGWEKKQLDEEIKNGDWLVSPVDFNFIFKVSDEKKWDISSSNLGFDLNKLSGKSGLA